MSDICGVCHLSPGVCCCTCSQPALFVCSSCMLLHIASPGSHVIQSLPQVSSLSLPPQTPMNEFCSQCLREAPETVCCCEVAGAVLCRSCIATHNYKYSDRVHIALPMKARNYVSLPGYLERLTKRQSSVQQGVAEVRKNVSSVNECEGKLIARLEKVITEIIEYREQTLRQLNNYRQQLEDNIEKAKSDIESHIYEDDYVPADPIAKGIWEFTPGKLLFFSYQDMEGYKIAFEARLKPVEPVSDPQFIPATPPLFVPISQPPKPPTPVPQKPIKAQSNVNIPLIRLTGDVLSFYDTKTRKFTKAKALKPANELSVMSSVVVLPSGKLFACGKEQPISNNACEIDLESGKVEPLNKMKDKRFGHGIVLVSFDIFVFGGTGTHSILRACEAFSLRTWAWRKISDMQIARDMFNPCHHSSFVYLFGGRGANECELYDPAIDHFRRLRIVMPAVAQTAAVVVAENEIAILQRGRMMRWRVGTETLGREMNGPREACWGNMNPIVKGSKVYIPVFNQATVLEISL